MVKYSNVLLCRGISQIGGIETFLYEIAKKYGTWDITVVYEEADFKQLRRLTRLVRCIRLTEKIQCKRCFLMYKVGIDMVEADEYIQMLHANYKVQTGIELNDNPKISRYLAVSNWVRDDCKEMLEKKKINKPIETCYNPITIEREQRPLVLFSATRLTNEKGKNRMTILANRLMQQNKPFIWLVFTNDTGLIDNPYVVYMKPTLDIRKYMLLADYVVQLSDTEGCPYTPIEANCLGKPVIITPVPSMLELGLQGYVLPFDMEDIDLDMLYNIPKVDYTPPKDIWDKLLIHDPSTYSPDELVEVITLGTFEYKGEWTMKGQHKLLFKEEAKELIEKGRAKEVV